MKSSAQAVPSPAVEAGARVATFQVGATFMAKADFRMDASFYADAAVAARRAVEDSGFVIKQLNDPAVAGQIFNLTRFKRIYTRDPKRGWPYLSASEALVFRPESSRWIARAMAPEKPERHFVKEGWLIVTCSGAIGRVGMATKRMEAFFLTHDLLRIVSTLPAGYLYAYLSSWIGQALMTKEQYGMAITHLEPSHMARIIVPLLPEVVQQRIHNEIIKAYRLRDEANDLLDKAEGLLYKELELPRFDESRVPYLTTRNERFPDRRLRAFAIQASDFADRFDVSFHLPIVKACITQMMGSKFRLANLCTLADVSLPPRFKRIYVSREHGVPFLQGSHIPLMKPYDLKYLSRRANARFIEECLVHPGWVLLTRSGTIGRIMLVPSNLDGWVASEHCLRLTPKEQNRNLGYVAAFLMTPYGQHQLTAKIYGGVVDELTEDDTAAVRLPAAPPKVQERIGGPVVAAFEKKEEANQIENATIRRLESLIAAGSNR